MAEAFGIASGVATFIDAGSKVLHLCTRIKDAPERIRSNQKSLKEILFNEERD